LRSQIQSQLGGVYAEELGVVEYGGGPWGMNWIAFLRLEEKDLRWDLEVGNWKSKGIGIGME